MQGLQISILKCSLQVKTDTALDYILEGFLHFH